MMASGYGGSACRHSGPLHMSCGEVVGVRPPRGREQEVKEGTELHKLLQGHSHWA